MPANQRAATSAPTTKSSATAARTNGPDPAVTLSASSRANRPVNGPEPASGSFQAVSTADPARERTGAKSWRQRSATVPKTTASRFTRAPSATRSRRIEIATRRLTSACPATTSAPVGTDATHRTAATTYSPHVTGRPVRSARERSPLERSPNSSSAVYPREFWEKKTWGYEIDTRPATASASKRANTSRATQYAAGAVATPATSAGSRMAHSSYPKVDTEALTRSEWRTWLPGFADRTSGTEPSV